jgi:hypothetical protein
MPNTSPNMKLPIPIPGVDTGLTWENSLVSCLTLIDQHMHAPNYGVQIPSSGLNINGTLSINNQYLTSIGGLFLTQYASPISSSLLSVLYSGNGASGDLFYNDGAGNQVRITEGGAVNATSSGISSGTATAAFSAGLLVVNSATNTPANIQGASLLLGNNLANSKYLTLSPPSSMASNISMMLPTIPVSTSFLQMDSSGNMSGAVPTSQGLTGSNLANNTIGSQQRLINIATSPGSGSVSVGNSLTQITTNFSLTTSGNPVDLSLTSDNVLAGSVAGIVILPANATVTISIYRGGGVAKIAQWNFETPTGSAIGFPISLNFTDQGASAGTNIYSVYAICNNGTASIIGVALTAIER